MVEVVLSRLGEHVAGLAPVQFRVIERVVDLLIEWTEEWKGEQVCKRCC